MVRSFNNCTDKIFKNGMPFKLWVALIYHSRLRIIPLGHIGIDCLLTEKDCRVWDGGTSCAFDVVCFDKIKQMRTKCECKQQYAKDAPFPGYDVRQLAVPIFDQAVEQAKSARTAVIALQEFFSLNIARACAKFVFHLVM